MERPEQASWAAFNADPDIAKMIVTLGLERMKGQQDAGAALDTRITQVAFGQLAAAAFAGSFVVQAAARSASEIAAAASCGLFVVGALIACFGVAPGRQQVAGLPPAWWYPPVVEGEDDLAIKEANAMVAETVEAMIQTNARVNDTRSRLLTGSLVAGGAAGIAVAAAALLKVCGT